MGETVKFSGKDKAYYDNLLNEINNKNIGSSKNKEKPVTLSNLDIEQLSEKRKYGFMAAGLNLLLPGAGYIYCGRIFLGIIALPFFILFIVMSGPIFYGPLWAILIIDGFISATIYNKKLDKRINAAMRTCPMCSERILPEAKVCKHCGHKLALQSV